MSQSDTSVERVSQLSQSTESHVQTDRRTNTEPHNDRDILSLSATRAHVQEFDAVSLGSVIGAGFLPTEERFEVTRTGEREPIPYQLRAAIWLRDRGVCQKCHARNPKPWHPEHIVPWSAGGPDVSPNLRVLCEACNVERSNYDDRTTFAKRAVTWWCHRCYVDPIRWDYTDPLGVKCPTHRHRWAGDVAMACAVERIYHWQRESNEASTWHKRGPIESLVHNAYCAHCGLPGLTDVTL